MKSFTIFFKALIILSGITCLGSNVRAQDILSILQDPVMNDSILKEHKIRSVTVLFEYGNVQNRSLTDRTYFDKIRDAEFDENGRIVYNYLNHGQKFYSDIDFCRNGGLQTFEYDSKGQLLKSSSLFRFDVDVEEFEYDGEGNIIGKRTFSGNELLMKETFDWKNGKMKEGSFEGTHYKTEELQATYDEKGRMVLLTSERSETTTVYEDYEDSVVVTEKTVLSYRENEVAKKVQTISDTRILSFQLFLNDDLGADVQVSYDAHGNVTSYRIKSKLNADDPETAELEELLIEIDNQYDSRGLLTKRTFYFTGREYTEKRLDRIEWYVYENQPLRIRHSMED